MSAVVPKVVKVGGARLAEPGYLEELTRHARELLAEPDDRVILIHGGGKEIGNLHERLGLSFRKKRGLRVTPDETMDLVAMVLCGLVNKRLVARFVHAGLDALGVCGADLGILHSEFLNRPQLGRVGGPPSVDGAALRRLLATTRVLVVSPVCIDSDGGLLNVNADVVAQVIAVAVEADRLDFVTDVTGVRDGERSLPNLSPRQVDGLIQRSVIGGGMIPKLQASLAALDGGVDVVRVGSLESLENGTATEVSP